MFRFVVIAVLSWLAASSLPLVPILSSTKLTFGFVVTTLFICGVIFHGAVVDLINSYRAKRLGCKPPPQRHAQLPLGWDIINRLVQADKKNEVPEDFPRVCAELGHTTWKQRVLGTDAVLTVDPKNVQAVLATNFKDFSLGAIRKNAFGPLLGHGIFTVDGKHWEHSRALLRPQFTRDQVGDLDLEENHIQHMFQHLPTDSAGWTSSTNLGPLFFRLTMDSATEFLFGHSVDSQLAALPNRAAGKQAFGESVDLPWDTVANSFDNALKHVGSRARLRSLFWLHNPKEFQNDCREVHRFADYYVDQALNAKVLEKDVEQGGLSKGKKYVFLDELVKSTRDRTEIRYQLLNILLAGRDTTAGLMGWTFWLLARHPQVFSKLRETVLASFGTYDNPQNITFATLKSCAYLQHVLNEVLRLFPSVPANGRSAIRDTTLPKGGGPDGQSPIFIPKGTDVVYSVLAMQRRRDIWGSDAEEFRPERWSDEGRRRPGWEYLPFNGGPRICLGQQFALTEAGYVIVRMMQKYDRIENSDLSPESHLRKHQFGVTSAPLKVDVRLHVAAGDV